MIIALAIKANFKSPNAAPATLFKIPNAAKLATLVRILPKIATPINIKTKVMAKAASFTYFSSHITCLDKKFPT